MRPSKVHSTILAGPGVLQTLARPRPPLGPGQVRVAVEQCGICDSDVRRWQGHGYGRLQFPVQLGHEFAGKVVELGPGVEGLVGQRVAVWAPSYVPVSAEHPSVRGLAQEVVAEAWHCFPVGDQVRFPFAAEPLGRVITTIEAANPDSRSHTVIIGSGFKALLALAWSRRYHNPKTLMLVTRSGHERAIQLGATHAFPPENAYNAIKRATRHRHADVVYELTGTQAGLNLATLAVCRGGKLVAGSAGVEPGRTVNGYFLEDRGVRYLETDKRDDEARLRSFALGVARLNRQLIDLDPLPILQYPGEKVHAAFEEAARGIHKVVVTP